MSELPQYLKYECSRLSQIEKNVNSYNGLTKTRLHKDCIKFSGLTCRTVVYARRVHTYRIKRVRATYALWNVFIRRK